MQPKATAGMINVDELRVVNSKVMPRRLTSVRFHKNKQFDALQVDKVLDSLSREDTQLQVV